MRNQKQHSPGGRVVKTSTGVSSIAPDNGQAILVSGPKLRRMLGISAPTLWRWRHDDKSGFPPAKSIKGRLYFPWQDVSAWLDRQEQAA